jgi:V/A-type H+-transporting ATPase subunit I
LVLAVDPDYAESVQGYLEAKGIRPLALPPHVEGHFIQGIAQLKAEASTIPQRLHQIDEELKSLAQEDAGRILVLTNALENRLAQLEAAMRFGYTDYTLLISGWVPQDELPSFQTALSKEFPDIIVQKDPGKFSSEEIPVALKERSWARPYRLFLQAFGTPKHGSIDPVPYISIFFPIFFGVIVGDVGYGLILLALALWGLRGFPGLKGTRFQQLARSESGQLALQLILHASAFTILFGLFFGELFGLEEWAPWPHYSRLHNPVPLMLFAIGIGAIQVVLGFLFGMVTAWRRRDPKHLAVKIGLFSAMLAISLLMGSLIGLVPEPLRMPWLFIALIVVALPLLVYGGGFVAIMEGVVALTPFVHVLSYLRLMGFAVAGVVLASLANMLVSGVSTLGGLILGLILGAIIALCMHTFVLVLHVFEGAVQSARLHWVEFFEKFMLEELGGKPYQPFKEKPMPVVPEK